MIPFRTTAPGAVTPAVTMGLIVANIAVYFYHRGLPPEAASVFVHTYALVPAVYTHPALALRAGLDPHNYLAFVSNTFLHGGALHLIVNMWTLWLFGIAVELRLRRWRFELVPENRTGS